MGTDEQLDQLEERLAAIHLELERENRKRDRRILTNKVLNVASIIAVICAAMFAWTVHQDERAAAARTATARIATCNHDNAGAITQRNAERLEIRKLIDALVAASADPGLARVRADAFLNGARKDGTDGYYATIDRAHPLRDCTPQGIARYLNIAGRNAL